MGLARGKSGNTQKNYELGIICARATLISMKNKKIIAPLFLLVAFVGLAIHSNRVEAAPSESGADWMTDFEAAKSKAQAEGKPMLLDFTGSDWCIWCVRLTDEVFSRKAFVDYADDELVLVKIDFPRDKPQSDELKAQNKALAEKYGIRGFPTIILLSPEGEMIEKTGYRRGGPDEYVSHLKSLLGKG